jgi:hypothetical protein
MRHGHHTHSQSGDDVELDSRTRGARAAHIRLRAFSTNRIPPAPLRTVRAAPRARDAAPRWTGNMKPQLAAGASAKPHVVIRYGSDLELRRELCAHGDVGGCAVGAWASRVALKSHCVRSVAGGMEGGVFDPPSPSPSLPTTSTGGKRSWSAGERSDGAVRVLIVPFKVIDAAVVISAPEISIAAGAHRCRRCTAAARSLRRSRPLSALSSLPLSIA